MCVWPKSAVFVFVVYTGNWKLFGFLVREGNKVRGGGGRERESYTVKQRNLINLKNCSIRSLSFWSCDNISPLECVSELSPISPSLATVWFHSYFICQERP